MPKLTFQWNSVPKLTLGAGVHRLVPKLFRAGVTRTEHRLPRSSFKDVDDRLKIVIMTKYFVTKITKASLFFLDCLEQKCRLWSEQPLILKIIF